MIAKALSQNLTGYARGNPTIMAESSVSDKRRRSKDAGGVRRRELPLVRQTDARQRESSTVTAAKTRNETEKKNPEKNISKHGIPAAQCNKYHCVRCRSCRS